MLRIYPSNPDNHVIPHTSTPSLSSFSLFSPLSSLSLLSLTLTSIASCVHEQCSDKDLAAHHLLLFISALIPKAMSSLLTSVVIELSKTENKRWCECCHDDSLLEDVLLEVQRLWPPFFGGRRISTQVHYLLQFLLSVCLSVCCYTYKNLNLCAVVPLTALFLLDLCLGLVIF